MKNTQSGNVLFYVLLAVALLAALSYTVAQTSRGGATNLTVEQAKLHATEIIEYANTVTQAVSQTRLRGYNPTEISFENTVSSGYVNANCIDDECKIFDINGGGIQFLSPPTNVNDGTDWLITVNAVEDVGSSDVDLVLILQNLDQTVCQEMNRKLYDVTTIPQEDDSVTLTKYTGTLTGTAISSSGALSASQAHCFEGNVAPAAGTYHYYQVLLAR